MKYRKTSLRLKKRQKSWDDSKFPDGFKRPGSYKKPYPKGSHR
jgi:hypothetical protein